MGYPAKRMSSTCVFRGRRPPFLDIARPPGHRLTPDRFHPPRKSLLWIAINFLGTSHFSNFLKLRKKVPMWPKPRFRLFRGQFRPEAGPAGIRKCFHSMRKVISDISMSSGSRDHLCTTHNSIKISFRSSATQNVFLSELNSSDTGNHLKTRISDLLQLLEGEALPTELLTRLRRHQESGLPTPPSKDRYTIPRSNASRPHQHRRQLPEKNTQMPNNASTKYGSRCQSGKQYTGTSRHSDGTRSHDARRAEPALLHDAWYRATAAKRHPDGQRDDGLTRDGRVTARRERIFSHIK
mgnify:CR=1 FL=1